MPEVSKSKVYCLMSEQLRVAMIVASPFPTWQGSQVLARDLALALQARGIRVVTAAYHLGAAESCEGLPIRRIRPFVAISGDEYRSGPNRARLLWDFLLIPLLIRLVREERIQILHAHNYEGALIGLIVGRLRRIPVLYHSHNLMGEELPSYSCHALAKFVSRVVGLTLDRVVPRQADHTIAFSRQAGRRLLTLGVKPERLTILAPGIRCEGSWAEKDRGHPAAKNSYLYAGNLDPYQNLDVLLLAAQRVARAVPGSVLEVVTHSDRSDLLVRARRLGLADRNLRFVRVRSFDEVSERMHPGGVAVLPRIAVGSYSIKLVNYLQRGMAVVAFESAGQGIEHLKSGWLARDGDVEGFARGIVALLRDPELALQLGRNALRAARQEFSPNRVAGAIEIIYERLLQTPR